MRLSSALFASHAHSSRMSSTGCPAESAPCHRTCACHMGTVTLQGSCLQARPLMTTMDA